MLAATFPLVAITAPTPRSRLLTIDLGHQRFTFSAGQAVLMAPLDDPEPKPFSIACSPEQVADTRQLELLIAIDAATDLGWAAPGTLVSLEGPMGTFMLPDAFNERHVLFVAGGTGIAPLRAMIDHLLAQRAGKQLALLYSARRADEFAFIDELRGLEQASQIELHQTVTRDESPSWQGRRGRIGRPEFEAVMHEPASTLCFVCGPPSMVNESVAVLLALGVSADAIRTEQWGR